MLRSGGVPPRPDKRWLELASDTSESLPVMTSATLLAGSSRVDRKTFNRPKHRVHHPLTSSFAGYQITANTQINSNAPTDSLKFTVALSP